MENTIVDQKFIERLSARMAEQETQFSDSKVTSNRNKFRKLVAEHARLKKLLEKAKVVINLRKEIQEHHTLISLDETEPELKQLAREDLLELQNKLPQLEKDLMIALVPPDPSDSRNTIVEIRAGTGGIEAALFAGDLLRMYTRYAERNGWKTELINASASEIGGYKEVVFSLQGENVFRKMQYEAGTHRVQRIPATEGFGRIHTSAATVAVLPEAEKTDEIEIKPDDLRIDLYRASGAGGQHVNKTDSAVRLTHLPTGIVVTSQEERSQHKNKVQAMRVLRARLLAEKRKQANHRMGDTRRSQIGSGDRSERIRTYNFPQNRITDHRINVTIYSLNKIMEGELEGLIKALLEHDLSKRLEKYVSINQVLEENSSF